MRVKTSVEIHIDDDIVGIGLWVALLIVVSATIGLVLIYG